MAQHDYVIANGTGAAVRSDINGALAAIVSNNSGATAPSTTYAYMPWADTTTGLFKIRNAANNGWITLYQLDGEWSTIALENGTAGAPSIYFKDSGTDTGIYSPGADQVAISTGGTVRLSLSTTAVSSALAIDHPLGAVGTPSITFTGDLNTGLWSPAADTIAASTGGTERLRIDSSGRVGIGTTPDQLLHVKGSNSRIKLQHTVDDAGSVGIEMCNRNSGSNPKAAIMSVATGSSWGIPNLVFYVDGTGDSGSWDSSDERMRIDSSGRLLVGTSSTSADHRALFQSTPADTSGFGSILVARGTSTGLSDGSALGVIAFSDSGHVKAAQIGAFVDGGYTSGTDQPTRLVFSTTADGASSPTERMRIVSGGNLIHGTIVASNGVGANTTNSGIEVGGGAVYHQVANNSSSGAIFTNYYRGSTVIGGISQNGTTGVTYATTSDYRLKENVEPITGAADRVLQLKPSRFNFIAAPDRIVDGFIAHEAQIVVPECATGTKDEMDDDGNPVYQGIDQSKLVPLLTAALQEALAEITSLKDRVAALEAS